jgi:porphobilinogen deaminase
LRAVVASPDGRQMISAERRHADPEVLGEQLAHQLLLQGAGAILGLEERRA